MIKENKISKYLLYAIGEIVLVMVGILLALQVNTWNHQRKEHKLEVNLYGNLLESLTADSVDLVRVRGLINNGQSAQRFFIGTPLEDLTKDHSIEALKDSIAMCSYIAYSFFPRYSVYQEITNNGYLELIRSVEIKSKLAELYDRSYSRYQHIDASVDEKSELFFEPIIRADFRILLPYSGVESSDAFDLERFKTHYPAFLRESMSIFSTSLFAQNAMSQCQQEVNELLTLLRAELEYCKP